MSDNASQEPCQGLPIIYRVEQAPSETMPAGYDGSDERAKPKKKRKREK